MQRTKLHNGMEVQVEINRWDSAEAVIVSTDIDVAHRTHRSANGHSRYRFSGSWDQAIAIAQKREDGTWVPIVTTTRKVLSTVEGYKIKKAADDLAAKHKREDADARRKLDAANRTARLEHNPAVVDALNEFIGAERAFTLGYNGHISVSTTAVVNALTEALGLEVL